MVIVFDLDDTLYDEMTFVRGGMRAVAHFLAPQLKLDEKVIAADLIEEVEKQRSHVFDRYLEIKSKKSKQLVAQCLSVYRQHTPDLQLFPEADDCLKRLNNHSLYVVTDGNKNVQHSKCMALGLPSRVRSCLYTHAHGIKHSKPSPHCFLKICALECVEPYQVVYVADNPTKDFVGLKPLGFHTIRVRTGPYRNIIAQPAYEAEWTIDNLTQLDESLLKGLK